MGLGDLPGDVEEAHAVAGLAHGPFYGQRTQPGMGFHDRPFRRVEAAGRAW